MTDSRRAREPTQISSLVQSDTRGFTAEDGHQPAIGSESCPSSLLASMLARAGRQRDHYRAGTTPTTYRTQSQNHIVFASTCGHRTVEHRPLFLDECRVKRIATGKIRQRFGRVTLIGWKKSHAEFGGSP